LESKWCWVSAGARPNLLANPNRLDRLLQLLGGAEGDLLAGLDLDLLAGLGIAAHARRALADLQHAEAADADARAALQMLGDVADHLLQNAHHLLLGHVVGL